MAILRKQSTLAVVPTLLTLANGACGLGSIAMATMSHQALSQTDGLFYAGVLIYLGMVFDGLDGYVARLLKQTSQLGVELDSLCDAITFTAAPVFIMIGLTEAFPLRFLWAVGTLFMLCGLLRLARFNVEQAKGDDTHDWFRGLPTPAAAAALASFAVALPGFQRLAADAMPESSRHLGEQIVSLTSYGLPILTVVLASLMVSRIRYPHLLNQWTRGQRNFLSLVQLVFAAIALIAVHELALPLVFCYYALGRPLTVWIRFAGMRIRQSSSLPHLPRQGV